MNQHIVPQDLKNSTCTACTDKDVLIARLTAERDAAEFCGIWGIYKREGIERRMLHLRAGMAVVVIDIDGMHDANDRHGDAGVDRRITRVMAAIRTDDTLIGRWKRGDEIVAFCHQDDAIGLARRLLAEFRSDDMSATAAVVFEPTHAGIALGIAQIAAAKKVDQRGRVYVCAGGLA